MRIYGGANEQYNEDHVGRTRAGRGLSCLECNMYRHMADMACVLLRGQEKVEYSPGPDGMQRSQGVDSTWPRGVNIHVASRR